MSYVKRALIMALALACILIISAYADEGTAHEYSTDLPLEISQEDWADARQYVKLSTGLTMAYVVVGKSDGPVVVLQHGMTDNSRSWSLAAPYFAEAGYHVYMPDLRGMGKSDAPDGYYTQLHMQQT